MKQMGWVIIIIGVLIAFAVLVYGMVGENENEVFHFKTLTIKGIVCPSNQDYGYVQDDTSDEMYNIPTTDCNIYKTGDIIAISYKHIHNPFAISDQWDFNNIVVVKQK
jgi:hypothetical protein